MLSEHERLLLMSGSAELGVHLSERAVKNFDLYAQRLSETNQQFNLTRVPAEKTVPLHFLDSLTITRAVSIPDGAAVLDVGTGAGFPGLPLAIAYPNIRVTLMDSTRKRLTFLEQLIAEMELQNVHVIHARAEEPQHTTGLLKRSFDIVTARAVAPMERLAGWLLPYVKPGGCAIAYKSADGRSEIEAARLTIKRLRGELEQVVEVSLPGEAIVRLLAVIRVGLNGSNQ